MTDELPLRHALALGLLHGPAELLPISSSAHVTLVPWLAGWPYERLDPRLRKSFEVALHAGTAAALLPRAPSGRTRPTFLLAAIAPPAAAGYALHGRIERRLGTPATIAAGLVAGSLALARAEVAARRRHARRGAREAGVRDGLAVGLAQALALAPGVSRSGAAFAAARARGFAARDAERLSFDAGLPVLGAAALLQTIKLLRGRGARRRRAAPDDQAASRSQLPAARSPLAVGAAAAFGSTLLTAKLLNQERRSKAALPASLYRLALAWIVLARLRARPAGRPSAIGGSPPSPPNKKNLTPTADAGGILEGLRASP